MIMVDLKKYLGQIVKVEIDRPLGSKHPKHGFDYLVNYGFLPNTKAADGEEIDVYVLVVDKPIMSFEGRCIAIVHRTNDNDDKLVIVPENSIDITDDEIREKTYFQERYFQSEIVR